MESTKIILYYQRLNFGFKFMMFLEFLISIGTSARIFGSKYDSDSMPAEPFSYF